MMFTVCLLLALTGWVVALGRQATPRAARVPFLAATGADVVRDATRGLRELGDSADRRPATVPVPGQRSAGATPRQPAAHL